MTMEEPLYFRLIFIICFALMMTISGYYRKKARESGGTISRREEGGLALILRLVLTLPLLLAILFYAFFPQWMSWAALGMPTWGRWLGVGFAIACIPLSRWVFKSIGGNISETVLTKPTHQLVMKGPYRWIRHPLYSVGMLMILSLSLIADNWFMLLLWVIGLFVFRYLVIPIEEERLIAAFGEEYKRYRERTGAMMPRV
jgi:protein-S-isoprenylcysteine O-methyltransferase Ste14